MMNKNASNDRRAGMAHLSITRAVPAFTILIVALALTACAGQQGPALVAKSVSVTAAMPGKHMQAAYLELENTTRDNIRITHVTSPDFGAVEIHETTTIDGIARMRPLEALDVPPRGSVLLERGGKHLMLMNPVGTPELVTLEFHAGENLMLRIVAPVVSAR